MYNLLKLEIIPLHPIDFCKCLRSSHSIYLYHFFTDHQVNNWIVKYGWREMGNGIVYIANQEDNIKTKNITEKISFESKYMYLKYLNFNHSLHACIRSLF